MMPRIVGWMTRFAGMTLLAVVAAGCEAQKSANPLSPSVAGPIAGVSITVPAPISPSNGAEIVNTDPLRLTFTNATTNGVRPLWYVVELASDSAFGSKIYTNGKVLPTEGAQTSVVVDVRLTSEATYFWRVRAEDGANSTAFSDPARFDMVVPVVLGVPSPLSPSGGQTTASVRPDLVVNNGTVTGRAGPVENRVEIARDQAFTSIVATAGAGRSSGTTTAVTAPELPANTMLYWRAYATNGTVASARSATAAFRTPAGTTGGGPVPLPPTGGGRTPDPAPGQRLPLPDMSWLVRQVANDYPAALRNSCQSNGGTWEFMDRVVNELRRYDTRWGYNWKRGNVGDPSLDVVDYHYGPGADEGSTDVYIIDIIGGHCGSSPSVGWTDVTDVTLQSGTIGRWTGRGRF